MSSYHSKYFDVLIEGTLKKKKDSYFGGFTNRHFKVCPNGILAYAKINYNNGSLEAIKNFDQNAKEINLKTSEIRDSQKDSKMIVI